MKISRLSILCLTLLLSTLFAEDRPKIFHRPSQKYYYNQFDRVTCIVDPGQLRIKAVNIYIKENPKKKVFTEYAMYNDNGVYTFQIIPEMTEADSFIYFITAEFSNFSLLAFPENEPKVNPLSVPIVQMERAVITVNTNEVEKIFCDLGRNIKNVKSVTIFTKYGAANQFNPVIMKYTKERYQYTVVPPSADISELSYYIIVEYNDFSILMYPSADFENNPDYRILNGRRM